MKLKLSEHLFTLTKDPSLQKTRVSLKVMMHTLQLENHGIKVELGQLTSTKLSPIPMIDELIDKLHGAKKFSNLDLKSGYL